MKTLRVNASPHKSSVADILKQRTTSPPVCPNSNRTRHILNIFPLSHNWTPFYFRCKALPRDKHSWLDEAFVTKQLLYSHVFKAAGTTINHNLERLIAEGKMFPLTKLSTDYILNGAQLKKYSQHVVLDSFLDGDTIMFSFVRDPIQKFLSGFYEAHMRIKRRQFDTRAVPMFTKYAEMSGIEIMRAWIREILHRLAIQKKRNQRRMYDGHEYINAHLLPNTHFVFGEHYAADLPFSYIGDLKHLNNDFPQILESFLLDEAMKQNHSRLMEWLELKRRRKHDNWEDELSKFSIDRAELTASDIDDICEMYWLDYMCFPFDVPNECDLEGMVERYYGENKQLVYRDCY